MESIYTTYQDIGKENTIINVNNISKIQNIKNGIIFYLILLILEGALRKWVLPQFSTPLLLIRDPIAIWLIIQGHKFISYKNNYYIFIISIIGFIGIFTAVFFGHGNIWVAIYGARILLIHFPLIFLMGNIFNLNDVIRVGKLILYISIPMAILIAIQFYSPQSAWVNRGVDTNVEGAGFGGAMGFFRPPGTFSFTNGVHLFFGICAPFIFYFWLNPKYISKLLLIGATLALFSSIPFSISRTLVFHISLTLFFTIIAVSRNGKMLMRIIFSFFVLILVLLLLNKINFFHTATEALITRFDEASMTEGGLNGTFGNRFLGGMLDALAHSSSYPFFGFGEGMGTNVGAQLLVGHKVFLIAEEEWGRIIGEMGALIGLILIMIRLLLALDILKKSFKETSKGNLLPFLLSSISIILISQGQWAQPTALGFTIVISGLTLGALS